MRLATLLTTITAPFDSMVDVFPQLNSARFFTRYKKRGRFPVDFCTVTCQVVGIELIASPAQRIGFGGNMAVAGHGFAEDSCVQLAPW